VNLMLPIVMALPGILEDQARLEAESFLCTADLIIASRGIGVDTEVRYLYNELKYSSPVLPAARCQIALRLAYLLKGTAPDYVKLEICECLRRLDKQAVGALPALTDYLADLKTRRKDRRLAGSGISAQELVEFVIKRIDDSDSLKEPKPKNDRKE
jgi:hypothetical protein